VNYLDKNGYFDSKFDSPNSVYGIGFDGMSEEDKEVYEESLDRFVGDFQTSLLLAPLGFGFSGAIGKAAPLLSKFTGKAKDILGKAIKYLGKTADKVDEVAGGTNAFRYMTEGELTAIQNTGFLRGGNPGKTYFTKDLYKSGAHAQQRLSLPTTPQLRVEFKILNNPSMKLNGAKVLPDFGMPGKGSEFMTIDPVRVRLINWQPLR